MIIFVVKEIDRILNNQSTNAFQFLFRLTNRKEIIVMQRKEMIGVRDMSAIRIFEFVSSEIFFDLISMSNRIRGNRSKDLFVDQRVRSRDLTEILVELIRDRISDIDLEGIVV